jgi:hypothetical protein
MLARSAGAQLSSTLDAAYSGVAYEGYLPTDAVTVAPEVTLAVPRVSASGYGALTRFASGHLSDAFSGEGQWTAAASGSTELRLLGNIDAGAYQVGPSTVREQIGVSGLLNGGWIRGWGTALAGSVRQPSTASGLVELIAGGAVPLPHATVSTFATQYWLGGFAYTDLDAAAQIWEGPLLVRAGAGVRGGYTLSGRRQWAHADVSLAVLPRLAITGSVGTYPRDPTANVPGVRVASVGVTIGLARERSASWATPLSPEQRPSFSSLVMRPPVTRAAEAEADSAAHVAGARAFATITVGADQSFVISVQSRATTVEVSGDFTHWAPATLTRDAHGVWSARFSAPPGLHRFDVRVDHGPWTAPAGVSHSEDDLGGEVGEFLVP